MIAMNKKTFMAAIALSALIILASFPSSQLINPTVSATDSEPANNWPMFHHDPLHSGASTGNPTLTPTLLWNYTTGFMVESSPAVVDGVVYIGSEDGNVYALNAVSGTKIWSYTTGNLPTAQTSGLPFLPQNGVGSSPAVVNGVVYVGALDSNVYALNAANGNRLWNYTTGYIINSNPIVINGIVYVGSLDNNIYALDAVTGNQLWNFTTNGPVYSSPAVVNDVVYIGSVDGNVYALSAADGTKIWNYTTEVTSWIDHNAVESSPSVVEGVVYVGSGNYNVYALKSADGAKLWGYTTGGEVNSSPAVANGIVYVGSNDGNVYALNASSGDKIWSYTTDVSSLSSNAVYSSPAFVGGIVYVGSDGGGVYALNASNGNKIWNYTTVIAAISRSFYSGNQLIGNISYTGNQVGSSPAVVDGVVYIGSYDGTVYALGSPVPSLPFSTLLGIAVVLVAAAIVGTGLLIYYKKRKHERM
jgi:eukaryotic-like serine/threonine-protein kinase